MQLKKKRNYSPVAVLSTYTHGGSGRNDTDKGESVNIKWAMFVYSAWA
jgi:hypothetical protein